METYVNLEDFVAVRGGTYMMGSPEDESGRWSDEKQISTTVEDFSICKYLVTVKQFRAFVIDSGYDYEHPLPREKDDHPVTMISWIDCQAYCKWLSEETGHEFRLPTEAEWEYAARGGTQTPYYTGEEITEKDANFNNHVGDTTPVGSYPPNPYGLFDMLGNVWEWCQDKYKKR
jgi:formylglycine-generating enzyme required for sulfatase activity